MRTVARQSLKGVEGSQGLLLDESGWEKVGIRSMGVARQYIGQVGNAQVGVFAALVRGDKLTLPCLKARGFSDYHPNGRVYLPS